MTSTTEAQLQTFLLLALFLLPFIAGSIGTAYRKHSRRIQQEIERTRERTPTGPSFIKRWGRRT